MNRTLLCSWMYGPDEESVRKKATEFYNALKNGVNEGNEFPFECPYQVYLLRNKGPREWVVAVQVMRGTPEDDSIEQTKRLMQWFEACGAPSPDDKVGKPMSGSTIGSALGRLSFEFIDTFGVIINDLSQLEENEKLEEEKPTEFIDIGVVMSQLKEYEKLEEEKPTKKKRWWRPRKK